MTRIPIEIEPRGTVYHDGPGHAHWLRVINGTVYAFTVFGDTGDGWWQVTVTRWPYGHWDRRERVHRWEGPRPVPAAA